MQIKANWIFQDPCIKIRLKNSMRQNKNDKASKHLIEKGKII